MWSTIGGDCCPITGMTAFLDKDNTSPTAAQLVSPYHDASIPGTGSENFWQDGNEWKFDGLLDEGEKSNRRRVDLEFYVRVTQSGGAHYWLGGTGTETKFSLYCEPCKWCNVEEDGSTEIHLLGLESSSNLHVYSNYQ